jgi:LuxR family transcriptional regulator, maltose regulon positive regulatory protein
MSEHSVVDGRPPGRPVVQLVRPDLDVLLETKLQAPRVRKEWVPRPGLVRVLDSCESKLILVDAPAGYGKTTVLAQWGDEAAASRPFAWISLDRGDDDPARLWQHVICSLQRVLPGLRGGEILRPLQRQVPDVEEALARLVNELSALAAPVVIILDDYHVIRERPCHEQLEFLLLRLPPSAQVVLSTRADPPLPLGRLRAAGEMAEIRMLDLHFTEDEAAALIQQVASVNLGQQALADLVGRTEGWPAGLYLAALSLRGHPAPQDFVRDFTGGNRYVVDFLAEEVVSRQPEHIRQFLSRTAVLGRFTAPLCDAVAGTSDARDVLDALERENLFLIALDDNREWFRYHHLFAQLQLAELARSEPGTIPALHQQASAWHLEHGSVDEAVGHALAAGDVAGSVRLIATHWYRYVDAGRAATVCGWLHSLGDERIEAHPLAAHCAAWVAALRGDREGVRRWLPVIAAGGDEGPLPDGMRSLRSSAALLDGSFGFGGLEPMRTSAAEAVDLETNPVSPWYALARAGYGGALYFCGEFQAAARQLEQALLHGSSIALVRMVSFAMMSLVAVEEGRLDQAEQLAHSARDVVTDDALGLSESPQASIAAIAVGAVLAGQGRFEDARGELERALRSRRQWFGISQWPTIENLLRLAPVRLELGDLPGAVALLGEAREILTSFPDGAGAQLSRLDRLERQLAGPPRTRLAVEPLTEREQAVLRLLRGTLSTREIGQQLYLSGNTIKTHTRSIYRKLGVSSRHDAVERGRELGLH